MNIKFVLSLVAGCLMAALSPRASASSISWTGAGDGSSWGDAHNWSGNVLPGLGDDVAIGAVAGNPTIQVSTATGTALAHSLTSNEPFNVSGGILQVTTTIQVSQTLSLSGGIIKGAVVTASSQALLAFDTGTLDGVTLGTSVTVATSLTVLDGLTLANNARLTMTGSAQLTFQGTQTLGGAGDVFFSGNGSTYSSLKVKGTADNSQAGAAILTVGPSVLVHGSEFFFVECVQNYDGIVNLGTFNADSTGNGQAINFVGDGTNNTLQNRGTIEATAGNLSFNKLAIDNTAGTILSANGGSFGTDNLTTIKGGTVMGAAGGTPTFDGVTINGPTVSTGSLTVLDGLTLANNARLTMTGSAQLTFQGTQTLGGAGDVFFSGNGSTYSSLKVKGTADNSQAGAAILTVGPSVLVHGSEFFFVECVQNYDGIVNLGTFNADSTGSGQAINFVGDGTNNTLQNRGTIEATAGNVLVGNYAFTNAGTVLESGTGNFGFTNTTTIVGGTISGILAGQPTLNGVTIDRDTTVGADTTLTVINGLTLANNAKLTVSGNSSRQIIFQGTQTLGGTGEVTFSGPADQAGFMDVRGTNDTPAGGATLTVGPGILIDGGQTIYIEKYHSYDSLNNLGTIDARTNGQTVVLQFGPGTIVDQGTLGAHNGGSMAISETVSINGQGRLDVDAASFLYGGGSVLGNSTSVATSKVQGSTTLSGSGSAGSPLLIEAMAQDLGNQNAGFSNNFAYGSLVLPNGYVKIVDYNRNATAGTASEAVYAQTVTVPGNCTLDLGGLHFYARGASIQGTVINGTVTVFSNAGPLALDTPTVGNIVSSGSTDGWTVYARAGAALSVTVNPGANNVPAPPSPTLKWANVQIVDPSGNVLANAASASAGAVVTLGGIAAPVDGTYSIRVSAAAASPSAAGYYYITASEASANEFALDIDAPSVGDINEAGAVDHWNFSAAIGTQVQFHLVNRSSSAVGFQLIGPGGVTVFHDLTGDSQPVNLPATGNYVLSAYSIGGGTGTYNFVLNQTTVTPLPIGKLYSGTWPGSGDAQLFTVASTSTDPLEFSLNDAVATDHVEIYARYGAPPTRDLYDYTANGAGNAQNLLIPRPKAGTYYVLVYGEAVTQPPTPFYLKAVSNGVVVTDPTAYVIDGSNGFTVTLTGAGFTAGTRVSLYAATVVNGGTEYKLYSAKTVTLTSPTTLVATFAPFTYLTTNLDGSPALDTIQVVQPGGYAAPAIPAQIVTSTPTNSGFLKTELEVPNPIGRHIAATLYLTYSNKGSNPLPAPLLIVDAINPTAEHGAFFTLDAALQKIGFWSASTPAGFSHQIQILGSGATPGVLRPGESIRVPIYYAGWELDQWDFKDPGLTFTVSSVQASATDPLPQATLIAALRPPGIADGAWNLMYLQITSATGGLYTNGAFVQYLDGIAGYLGTVGENVTDIGKLVGLGVAATENVWPAPAFAATVDQALPMPGALQMNFSRTFNDTIPGRFRSGMLGQGWYSPWEQILSVAADGGVTVRTGSGAAFLYEPDSRYAGTYFSQPGDSSTLSAVNGGYRLTTPSGGVTAFNADGTLNYLGDNNGNTITAGYASGRLTTLTASSGATFTFAYNGAGLLGLLTDSLGRKTTYTYDSANHLTSVLGYDAKTTTYTYTAPFINALASVILPDGTHQDFTYGGYGLLTSATGDNGTNLTTYAYNQGEVTSTDPLGHSISRFYNENGQVGRIVDGLGNPLLLQYDDAQHIVAVTNALGASAHYGYDNVGRLVTAADFDGNVSKFTYNNTSNRPSFLTDANGNLTRYDYDGSGNLTAKILANGRSELFGHDTQGNPTATTNEAGELIKYTYNAAGQVLTATFPDKSSYAYTYDSEGHLLTAIDARGTTTFTYDPVTRLLTKIVDPKGKFLSYTYDTVGRRQQMVDQSGYAVNYTYDPTGYLSQLHDGQGNILVSYTYGGDGVLTQQTNANGTYTTYQYDAAGNVLHLINYAPDGTVNSRFDDTYNAVREKLTETTLDGTWTYTYTLGGQLSHAAFVSNQSGVLPNQTLAYTYDAMGNRTSATVNGATTAYLPNSLNLYADVGSAVYSYDDKGNLISDGKSTYTYDFLNRPTGISNASHQSAYVYDALGNRVSSTLDGATTAYLLDPTVPNRPVSAYNASGSLATRYVYGNGLACEVSGGAVRAYDFDPTGNTRGITQANGTYANQYRYLPFGEPLTAVEARPSPFQFNGQWGVQSQNGASFMTSRNYAPGIGKFVSVDPLDIVGGLNLTLFANNNPLTLVDPLGSYPISRRQANNAVAIVGGVVALGAGAIAAPAAATVATTAFVITGTLTGIYAIVTGTINLFQPDKDQTPTSPGGFVGSGAKTGSLRQRAGNALDVALGGVPANPFEIPSLLLSLYNLYNPDFLDPDSDNHTNSNTVNATDPNALFGPAGYGAANFVGGSDNAFTYRITFENASTATAPAQSVSIKNNLSPNLNWSTFQLTAVGFGDFNLAIPAGSQHYQTTVAMTYNGQTFDVQIEAGIHTNTGQVYARFQAIDPNTDLPPSNVLTGFLPPEDGTGRGDGYLSYLVSPVASVANNATIRNVASITFDNGNTITTDQVDDEDPSKGTDPAKEAPVTIDSTVPTAHINALPSHDGPNIVVSWTGSDTGGSGIASYTVYVSSDGGQTYTVWLTHTQATYGVYAGVAGKTYTFYVVAISNVGTVEPIAEAQANTGSTYVDYPPQVTSAASAEVFMGQPFSYQITASNSPKSYGASGLPSGLSVNAANGLISGTPTQSGVFIVGLSATNDGGTGTAILTLTVDPPPAIYPVITSGTTATVILGQPFSYQITATNRPTSYGASGLPTGLSINTSSGLISGVPKQTGVFNVGLSAANAGGTGTSSLTLTVSPTLVVPPVIISVLTASAQATVAFEYQIVASNMPSVYGATGLPAGLTINTASGLISGTPTKVGTYQIGLSTTNSSGTGTATLALTVADAPVLFPTITSDATASTLLGQPFSYQIKATNHPTMYAATGLPAGLTLDTTTGLISGAPTATGMFNVGLSATNASGTGTATLTLTVSLQPVVAPVITSVLAANGQATVAFNYQITASHNPVSFDATDLPEGLSVNTASGLISGAPTTAGTYSIGLSAANDGGTGTATLVLTVAAAPLPVVSVTAGIPGVVVGSGTYGEFTLTLSEALPDDLFVMYAVKGTAVNGEDYALLKGVKKIKAGKTKVQIKVTPLGDLEGAPKKTVKFILESGPGYTIATSPTPVKVKILAGP